MVLIKRFILMIQFLTTIPVPVRIDASDEDYGKGLVTAPVVGLIIGAVLGGAWYLLSNIFPEYVNAILIMALYMLLSGGLHFDGLGDTMDGIFSHRPREKMLEIMRDSRIGTYALLGILMVVMCDIALIYSLRKDGILKVLLLMPVAGRIGSLISAGISRYARNDGGIGRSFIDNCGTGEILCGLPVYFLLFYLLMGFSGLLISLGPIAAAFVSTFMLTRKLKGATGDILGAVCEINQTVFLMFTYLVLRGI